MHENPILDFQSPICITAMVFYFFKLIPSRLILAVLRGDKLRGRLWPTCCLLEISCSFVFNDGKFVSVSFFYLLSKTKTLKPMLNISIIVEVYADTKSFMCMQPIPHYLLPFTQFFSSH